MAESTVRLDLRAVISIAALGIVVLAIIFVELCGREDVPSLAQVPSPVPQDTSTPAEAVTPGPSPTAGDATATEESQVPAEGEERDIIRQFDLAVIKRALEEYREENGSYPDSGNNIQTFCAFPDVDAGCELEEVLSPLPEDPLGDPAANGYWYASDGRRFTVYAQRESGRFEACPDHPDHLQDFDSLLCLQGS